MNATRLFKIVNPDCKILRYKSLLGSPNTIADRMVVKTSLRERISPRVTLQ